MKESWREEWRKNNKKNFSASLNMCREEKNSLLFLRVLFISKCTCPAAKGKGAPWTTSLGGTYCLSLGPRKTLCLLKFLLCSCSLQASLVSVSYSNLTMHTPLGTPEITKDSPCNLLCSVESQGMLSTASHLCIAANVELFHTDKTPPKCIIQM